MSLVTVPQVNPNDEVTALSVNQGPNAIAAVVNGNIDDANVSTISGTKITTGTIPSTAFDIASNPDTRESETTGNIVASGLVWSATSGLSATMTAGVAYILGKRLIVPTIATNAFTASRDTYVYVDSAGTIQYNPLTNGSAFPATPANSLAIAKVVTNGSTVTSISDLRVGSPASSWKSWTPTFTNWNIGTGGSAQTIAKWAQIGKTVYYRINTTLGTSGQSISGSVTFTLPVPRMAVNVTGSASDIIGEVWIEDNNVGNYKGVATSTNTTTGLIVVHQANGTYLTSTPLSATIPMTWTGDDSINITGFYEATA